MIKHVWFDVEGTLTIPTPEYKEAHDTLRYQTYADAVKKPLNDQVKQEYEDLYKEHGSNSAVFRSLGLPSDYWMQYFNTLDESKFFTADRRVHGTLDTLRQKVPISIFTNVKTEKIIRTFQAINVKPDWFTHILSGDDVQERKPALDGFYEIVKRSQLPAAQIMYVGDRIDVDIKPAKQVGIKSCLVWSTSSEADYSFENFQDILSLFGL